MQRSEIAKGLATEFLESNAAWECQKSDTFVSQSQLGFLIVHLQQERKRKDARREGRKKQMCVVAGMKLGFNSVSFLLGMAGLEKAWGAGDASVPQMLGKHAP